MNETEIKFYNDIKNKYNTNIKSSSDAEDIFKHYDFIIENLCELKNIKVDVKGLKKVNRYSDIYETRYMLVEIQNVNGNKGWIYGESDYIVQEMPDHWLFISTSDLKNYTELNVKKIELISNYSSSNIYALIYSPLTRSKYGRNDIFTWIPIQDIKRNCRSFEIPKL